MLATEKRYFLSQFRQFLFETIVPLEGLLDYKGDPLSKIMFFWRKKGLIPFVPNGYHKVNISFSDLLWMRVLDNLRQFGYPLEKQIMIADYFFKDAYNDELPRKNLTYNQKELKKKKVAGIITEEELHTLEAIERHLKDETYLYVLKFEINYLTNLIVDCIKTGEDRGVLIFRDGTIGEKHGNVYHNHRGLSIDPNEPHLYFSIQHLLNEFIDDKHFSEMYMSQFINEDEQEVIKQVERNNVEQITINEFEGPCMVINCGAGRAINKVDKYKIKKKLFDKQYKDIQVKTCDGNTHHYVNKKVINKQK